MPSQIYLPATGRVLAMGLICAAMASPARALDWSAELGLASDKVVRGLSLSGGKAALSADVRASTLTGWSASLGLAGPAYRGGGGEGEVSLALSKSWQADADWTLWAGAARYQYPGSVVARHWSYSEISVGANWRGSLSATVASAPDYSGYVGYGASAQRVKGRSQSFDLNWHARLGGRWTLDTGVGYQDISRILGHGYGYASVSLGWGVGPVRVFVSHIDSQARTRRLAPPALAGPRHVVSLLWAI